jgi:dipeptidase D
MDAAAQGVGSCKDMEPYLAPGAEALAGSDAQGSDAFVLYKRVISTSARGGAPELAARLAGMRTGFPAPAAEADLASCLLRHYVVAQYGDEMVRDLREMVAFRTFAVTGQENWNAPEFVRQREWLEARARALGFFFKSYDGRVEEITLPGPEAGPVLALLTHGDVQDVEGQTWTSPPWEGRLVDGKIVGRGTEDDKGPIVASLYAMAALRDSAWSRGSTVRLLVANGEESSWDEIPYYLARAPMPDTTVGLDAAYPIVHAQKGFGIITLKAKPAAEPPPGKWRVAKMSGGSGLSIIPERGEALLERLGEKKERNGARKELTRLAKEWSAAHKPAKLTVSQEGDLLKITAEGRSGHSSIPEKGHNALGDLTAFLATLDPVQDARGALATFVGVAVGTETNGNALGIAHRDPAMGDLTSSLAFLVEEEAAPVARINIRVPRGITRDEMVQRIGERTAAFEKRTGAGIAAEVTLASEPHFVEPEGPLVSTLLGVWQEVTGKPGRPVAIGGGTQARLFKGAVDFGPAESMEVYRGHGPDEYLTVGELERVAQLTVTALWRLAGEKK